MEPEKRSQTEAASAVATEHLPFIVKLVTVGLLVVVGTNAWVVEESYISLRVADNLIHGYGPRFNTVERVCAFSNPLWTFLLALVTGGTREVFFTSMALCFVLTALAVLLLRKLSSSESRALLALVVLGLSKSFVEWSTSGMENALGHFLYAAFVWAMIRRKSSRRRIFVVGAVFALCLCHRIDMIALVGPPYLYALVDSYRRTYSSRRRQWVLEVLLSLAPILLWELFATLYFGFPFPNTYYAKLTSGVPTSHLVAQGFRYAEFSLRTDPITIVTIAAALVIGFGYAKRSSTPFVVGLACAVGYVVWVGGDFMAGRFWSLPFFAAVHILSCLKLRSPISDSIMMRVVGVVVIALAGFARFPTITHLDYGRRPDVQEFGIADYARGSIRHSSLRRAVFGFKVPAHEWIDAGLEAKAHPNVAPVWGAMGYAGYYAGPSVVVIDKYALADGLLAHLPSFHPTERKWRIGHFERTIPAGYVSSVERRSNVIEDPAVKALYDDLLLIQRGPVFSRDRFAAMWRMWRGYHDASIREYATRSDAAHP